MFGRILVNRRALNVRTFSTDLKAAARAIQQADSILVCAGAGFGVDSGLPDFRGDEGFWKAYPPMKKHGYSFVDMANPSWFQYDPCFAHGFYGHRLQLYRDTIPHDGFNILQEWMQNKPQEGFVFTSNVDGHFQKAGFPKDRVAECHGSINHVQCSYPCNEEISEAGVENVDVDLDTFRATEGSVPQCPYKCGSVMRPNILMFGDNSWIGRRTSEQLRRMERWEVMMKKSSAKICVIECGAGTAVPTVRMQSEGTLFRHKNSSLVRLNVREPHIEPRLVYDPKTKCKRAFGISLGSLDALTQLNALILST